MSTKKLNSDIRLVIFDVDGTLRRMKSRENRAPLNDDEWEVMPGVERVINGLKEIGMSFGIATNQACVRRGEITYGECESMLFKLLMPLGLLEYPGAIKVCYHLPDTCVCRKPSPAMLYSIMIYYGFAGIVQKETLFVGDAKTDEQAAENCGCHFMYINEFLDLGKE